MGKADEAHDVWFWGTKLDKLAKQGNRREVRDARKHHEKELKRAQARYAKEEEKATFFKKLFGG